MIRSVYVRTAHAAGRAADRVGLAKVLQQRPGKAALYIRSLFAIYDLEAMLALDTPWWTFRAIDRVERFLTQFGGRARVFEFGSGASTAWLAKRASEVHSVEHDREFAEQIADPLRAVGATLHVVTPVPSRQPGAPSRRRGHRGLDFSRYVSTVDQVGGRFDLIVIDGRARTTALTRSIPHLAEGGMIVFDDAVRPRYARALTASGLAIARTFGLTPSLPYPWCTALAWRGSEIR